MTAIRIGEAASDNVIAVVFFCCCVKEGRVAGFCDIIVKVIVLMITIVSHPITCVCVHANTQ